MMYWSSVREISAAYFKNQGGGVSRGKYGERKYEGSYTDILQYRGKIILGVPPHSVEARP